MDFHYQYNKNQMMYGQCIVLRRHYPFLLKIVTFLQALLVSHINWGILFKKVAIMLEYNPPLCSA